MTRKRTLALVALLGGLVMVAPLTVPAFTSAAQENPSPAQGGGQPFSGVDFTGLTPAQTDTAKQILNETRCNCGCGMTLAECRLKDPNCSRSLTLSRQVVEDFKSGKDRAAVVSNLTAALAKLAAPPAAAPPRGRQQGLQDRHHRLPRQGSQERPRHHCGVLRLSVTLLREALASPQAGA